MKISNKNLYKYVYILIFLPLFVRLLTENFGFSYAIMPLFDIYEIVLLLVTLYISREKIYILKFWIIVFLIVGFLSIIANGGTSISDFFYSFRPYIRMVIAMMISASAMNIKNLENLFRYIEVLLYVNAIVMTYQFLFQGLRQDIIGGTFGNSRGVNSIQNILCIFVCCVTIEYFLKGFISKKKIIINIFVVLYISILAEINLVFLEAIIISILLVLLSNSNQLFYFGKKFFLIVLGVGGIGIGLYFFMKFNPDRLFLLSFNNALEYLGFNDKSTGVYRISRMKVFSQLGNYFFKNDISEWFLGYGLGNCSTHSLFYQRYQDIQYTFFSSSNVFLETGVCGVFANLGVILTTLVLSIKNKKNIVDSNMKQEAWMNISIAITVNMIILFFYNTTLRDTYTAFFAGTILVIPYIIKKSEIIQ